MCSVLADHTVEDMWEFLRDHGTHGEYIRENMTGVQAWIDVLKSNVSTLYDQWPIELAGRMCAMEPRNRPVAREILSMIFNFDGPIRYYGLCCDEQLELKDYLSNQKISTDSSYEENSLLSEPTRTEEYLEADLSLPLKSGYRFPAVEDPTEDLTVQAFFPPGGIARNYVLEDAELPGASVDLAEPRETLTHSRLHVSPSMLPRPALDSSLQRSFSPGPTNRITPSKISTGDLPYRMVVLDFIANLDISQLPCPWPKCSQQTSFSSHKSLVDHLRDCHGTHELFWTPLLGLSTTVNTSASSNEWVPGQIISEPLVSEPPYDAKAFILKRDVISAQASTDPYADHLRSRAMEIRGNFGNLKMALSHIGPEAGTALPTSVSPNDETKVPDESKVQDEPKVQEEPFIVPDRISEPSLLSFIEGDCQPGPPCVPKSSFVPSYHLAATNRLSKDQIQSLLKKEKPVAVPPPLFVYGSLMFPSVLRAQAENSISAEGIYSKALQRRIQTSAEDWSNMNESLQQTAKQMTPALLKDYLRFKDDRSGDAVLAQWPSSKDGTVAATKGFLVSGLSHEALVRLDYLFSAEGYDSLYGKWSAVSTPKGKNRIGDNSDSSDSDNDSVSDVEGSVKSTRPRSELLRQSVVVTISDTNGNPQTIDAITYKCKDNPDGQMDAWDLNAFVKQRTFDHLSTSIKSSSNADYGFLAEEDDIASKMGMSYVMRGDELCDRIVNNDIEGVYSLIANGSDVDAFCRDYGTPLQAAAANGQEKLVYVMLKFWKADANKRGGPYNSPLVAAICNGHEDVVNTLLKHGANPIAGAGSFVSPVYQAVSFEDIEMTKMLLERGGWLSKDYIELLDLAKETGNNELCDLIRNYDIRKLHQSSQIQMGHDGKPQSSKVQVSQRSNQLSFRKVMPALLEIFKLKGQKGKWTGMKAIKVLHVAYGDDVPDDVLNLLSTNLGAIQQLLMMLVKNEWPAKSGSTKAEEEKSNQHHLKFNHDAGNASFESKYSSRRKPLPASQVAPKPTEKKDHEPDLVDDDVFCLTCDGRGGRKGTGRQCERCHGKGICLVERPMATNGSKEGKAQTRCRACNGTGNIFLERDKCRACNYVGRQHEWIEDQRQHKDTRVPISRRGDVDDDKTERGREYLDPPPPYSGRN